MRPLLPIQHNPTRREATRGPERETCYAKASTTASKSSTRVWLRELSNLRRKGRERGNNEGNIFRERNNLPLKAKTRAETDATFLPFLTPFLVLLLPPPPSEPHHSTLGSPHPPHPAPHSPPTTPSLCARVISLIKRPRRLFTFEYAPLPRVTTTDIILQVKSSSGAPPASPEKRRGGKGDDFPRRFSYHRQRETPKHLWYVNIASCSTSACFRATCYRYLNREPKPYPLCQYCAVHSILLHK